MEKENKLLSMLQGYIDSHEIAGAVVMVRKKGELMCEGALGWADIENRIPVKMDTIFRLASMSKPVTGIAVMQLVEQGKAALTDPITRFFPEYASMKVCEKDLMPLYYSPDANSPTGKEALKEQVEAMTFVPAYRDVTVFDLLTHSSGLGTGPVGNALMAKFPSPVKGLQERCRMMAQLPLDFQPGKANGYSGLAAMELLGGMVERVSGMAFEAYLRKNLFDPLEIRDMGFFLTPEQEKRASRLYEYTEAGTLADVTDTDGGWKAMNASCTGFVSGAAGLLGTVPGYERIAHMLLNKGELDGVRILKPETVEAMAGKDIAAKHVPSPGNIWGLSMMVFQDREENKRFLTPGTYGWSGAFGTHFYMDPANDLEMVLGVNRSNIGGAGSYVSIAAEKAIFESYIQG